MGLNLACIALAGAAPAAAQSLYLQQGPKLVASDSTGAAPQQGASISLSADGNTMIVGAPADASASDIGAAIVWTRANGAWTEQLKIVAQCGSNPLVFLQCAPAQQGWSVGLSADGNTAIVGGPHFNGNGGAAWVLTRSGSVWSQQQRLGANDAVGAALQGYSVALSADGATAIVGAPGDNSGVGAAWIWTSANGVWSQQQKLFGTAAFAGNSQGVAVSLSANGATAVVTSGFNRAAWVWARANAVYSVKARLVPTANNTSGFAAGFGQAVAISADGSTIAVGAPDDNLAIGINPIGSTWVWALANGVWTLQNVLTSTLNDNAMRQGASVALSSDGSLLAAGASFDPAGGSVQMWQRTGGVWARRSAKLAGTGGTGVGLSADGATLAIGSSGDAASVGAARMFTRRQPHDFGGDSPSDVIVRDGAGVVSMWQMSSAQVGVNTPIATVQNGIWSVLGTGDFDGDGIADILWRNNITGEVWQWRMNGAAIASASLLGTVPAATWSFLGSGDFDGDGITDLIWRNVNTGEVWAWRMSGGAIASATLLGVVPVSPWNFLAAGDFDGDGKADALWHNNATGEIWLWFMNGGSISGASLVATVPASVWTLVGAGDFDGDGKLDLMWRSIVGDIWQWRMNGATIAASTFVANVPVTDWRPSGTGDYDGDGRADMLWRNTSTNEVWTWRMNGATIISGQFVTTLPVTTAIERVTN